MTTQTHDGYKADAKGRLVPLSLIEPIDLQRDEMVTDIVDKAKQLQAHLSKFKDYVLSEVQAFVDLSAQEYDKELGGIKGNVQLLSFDGKYKVVRAIAEGIMFDERLQVAKELIDKCIKRWSEGSRAEIQVLVQDAFQTDKQGKINTARVLGLKRLAIEDKEWQQAMQAITDSIQTTGSKTYVRLYERIGDSERFAPIPLDIAGQ
jgi:hypothetical protein